LLSRLELQRLAAMEDSAKLEAIYTRNRYLVFVLAGALAAGLAALLGAAVPCRR
jgi:hypothetical protein